MKKRGILYIQSTFRNTIITITDHKKAPLAWFSSGKAGFKGSRRSSKHAAESTAHEAGLKAIQLGIKDIEVIILGTCSITNPVAVLLMLKKKGLRVMKIRDKSRLPHNGCRQPKRRRV